MNILPFPSATKNHRGLFIWVTLFLFLVEALMFLSCKKNITCETCTANQPPLAAAGPDVVITLPLDSVLLDGSKSSDPDGKISAWQWTNISGPASFMMVNSAAEKTLVRNLKKGTYQFELKVTDDGGLSARDTVQVMVNDPIQPNRTPIANAGEDQVINLPINTVTLNGRNSTDPDNNITAYQWSKIAGPSSFSIVNASSIETLISNLVEGVYQFELKVTDAGGLFGMDTVQITVKPDPSLAIQWQKALGGTRIDIAQSIQPTPDGGYIVAGNTNSFDGDVTGYHTGVSGCYQDCFGQTYCDYFPDGLVVKLSNTGAIQWQKALGGSSADNLLSIQPTPDGGYITSGLTYSNDGDVSGYHGGIEADAWVVKLSSNGTIQWQKVLGGSSGCDFANAIKPTPDGGYIFVGHTDSHDGDVSGTAGERDVWVVKLSSSGAIQWQKTIGGSLSDYAYGFESTPDGGYILAGYSFSNNGDVSGNHGDADAWVVKISSGGAIQWQKTLGGSKEEIAKSIQPTTDGGYIVAGYTYSTNGDVSGNHGGQDAWVIKLSSTGSIQWQKALGGSNEEIAKSVQTMADGGFIIAGATASNNGEVSGNHGASDVWVVKLSNNGTFQWQKTLGGTASDVANFIQRTTDGGYIVAGQTFSNNGDVSGNHGGQDAWVIKLK